MIQIKKAEQLLKFTIFAELNKKINEFLVKIDLFKGILYFVLLLFFFHFSWKFCIDGDMDSTNIYVLGKDVTPVWFHTACVWLTQVTSWFVHLFPGSNSIVTGDDYFIGNQMRISIIWGCTGIKQMFIFAGVMICYFGPWKKKLWYIPMGLAILTVYNVIRIGSIVLLTNGHPERFESLHDGIFRYIYYTIIFIIWIYWEEVIVRKNRLRKNERQSKAAVSS